jgi:MFS family permease
MAAPLWLAGFPSLSLAYLVNELGNWLGEIALAILVFEETGSPVATAALFCAMQFLPALLGPPLVARVEHIPARTALPALYVAEAAAFAGLALLAEEFSLVGVLALAAFDGAIASAARALTRAAAAAALTPAGLLREGNAILNIAFTAGAAVGPALAGLIVAAAGVTPALLGDAASFLVVGVLLALTKRLPTPATDAAEQQAFDWRGRLRRSLDYARRSPPLRRLLTAQAAAFVFFALVLPIEVVFAKETLDAGDFGYGLMLASWGAGMLAGSLVFAAAGRRTLRGLLVASTLAIGLAYLGIAAAPTLAVACAASLLGGTGNGVQWIALVTAVQELTPEAFQARILALLEAIASAMPGIGFLLGGAIAALLEPRAAFAVAGAGVLAVLVLAALSLRRVDLRRPREANSARFLAGEASPSSHSSGEM